MNVAVEFGLASSFQLPQLHGDRQIDANAATAASASTAGKRNLREIGRAVGHGVAEVVLAWKGGWLRVCINVPRNHVNPTVLAGKADAVDCA